MKRIQLITLSLILSLGAQQAQGWTAREGLGQVCGFVKKHPIATAVTAATCIAAGIRISTLAFSALQKKQAKNKLANERIGHEKKVQKLLQEQVRLKHRYDWQKIDPIAREKAEREQFFKLGPIKDIDKNFTEELRNIKVNNISAGLRSNSGWIHYDNNRKDVVKKKDLIKQPQPSQFIDQTIDSWADNPMSYVYSFMNATNNYDIDFIVGGWDINNLNDKYKLIKQNQERDARKLNQNEKEKLQKEVIQGMAHVYKIHLQIKPQYLIRATTELLKFMALDHYGKYINEIKVAQSLKECIPSDVNTPLLQPIPVIVAYLPLIPGTKKEKNELLADILNALICHFKKGDLKDMFKDIALGITPRSNIQINEFIYLAQGHGDNDHKGKIFVQFDKQVDHLKWSTSKTNNTDDQLKLTMPQFFNYKSPINKIISYMRTNADNLSDQEDTETTINIFLNNIKNIIDIKKSIYTNNLEFFKGYEFDMRLIKN